jgi:anti-anti-sigma factor
MSGSADFRAIAGLSSGTVVLRGDFDMDVVGQFDAALAIVLSSEPSTLRIDLSQLGFLDSTGISCLVRANRAHPNVVLYGPSEMHLRLLEIMGLCTVFRIEDLAARRDDRTPS